MIVVVVGVVVVVVVVVVRGAIARVSRGGGVGKKKWDGKRTIKILVHVYSK